MEISQTTPALLYPTVSLLMLAYTQRFLALANLVRTLHARYGEDKDPLILKQISNLRRRIRIIRNMQFLGVLSLLFCTLCLFFMFLNNEHLANWTFGTALVLLMISLSLSVVEIQNSVAALDLHLTDLESRESSTAADDADGI